MSVRTSGFMERIRQLIVFGEYRGRSFVGNDKLGNSYYEIINEKSMFPCNIQGLFPTYLPCSSYVVRNRYVEYSSGWDRDASQIPAEW